MPESAANNKRIAKNTMLLYVRMVFIMAVQLYTSRVVLRVLGVEDYGIYNVVGGIVAMFAFLNWAMIGSSQRFITYELGRGDRERLKAVFATSIQIHAMLAGAIALLTETVGVWFLWHKMQIPPERMTAAMWVLQLSIATMAVQMMSAPYNAAIIAHERMGAFAMISVVEVSLKLGAALALPLIGRDSLIAYALLIALTQVAIRTVYAGYCRRRFPDLRARWRVDKSLLREMSSFASWNIMGNLAAVLYGNGLNLLLNVFFGPAVNAARAIAVQVETAIYQFAQNFQSAVNPQITKLYAQESLAEMHKLVCRSSKFSFLLLLVVIVPVVAEAEPILALWLGEVPEHSVAFLRIILCISLINAAANPIGTAAAATGRIRRYQLAVSGVLLTIVPLAYLALKLGAEPEAVFTVYLCVAAVAFAVRLMVVAPMIEMSVGYYARKTLWPCLMAAAVAAAMAWGVAIAMPDGKWMFIVSAAGCAAVTAASAFVLGLSGGERAFVVEKAQTMVAKARKR